MPQRIHASEFDLKSIFSNSYCFSIEAYQRPYSWQVDQASELLDDIRSALPGDANNLQSADPYFLGGIILVKQDDRPDSEVIDGQQRLTTLTILFAVLRDLMGDTGKALQSLIKEDGDAILGLVDRFRLKVRERDRDFFRRYVQERGGTRALLSVSDPLPDAQSNMRNNAIFFDSMLARQDGRYLKNLAIYLVQRCFLVAVACTDRTTAYRTFRILNTRGLDLSPTDVLKADILGAITENRREMYAKIWEDVEEDLGRGRFRDLFAHIRMIFQKAKARKELVDEFHETVNPTANPTDFIENTLEPLADAFEVVDRIHFEQGSEAQRKEINACLGRLHRLDNIDWVPPAMRHLQKNAAAPDRVLSFLQDLERLAYALLIRRAYATERIGRYAAVLRWVDGDPSGSAPDLSAEEKQKVCSVLGGPLYGITPVCLPVLLRLDELSSAGGATYDSSVVSIEHVLPQNPDPASQWVKDFPDEAEREQLTHILGNLVLLPRRKQPQASNFDFERKKKEYFRRKGTTPFTLTVQVINESRWTPDVIRERQQRLVSQLREAWRLT